MLILFLVTVGAWVAGLGLAGRLRPSAPPSGVPHPGRLSVIVPARNEESNLPRLLASLAGSGASEIVVVDDASEDRTAAVARERGARVVSSTPLPEGWRGKTWACHQGAQAAEGDLFLFVDADTWFEPGGLERIRSQYRGGALSVGPFHAVERGYEDLSLFFNLAMNFGTLPDGLFGPMLLIDRESYRRGGGHESVRGRILEHFGWASRLREAGIPVRSVPGRGLLSFRMYPGGVRELLEGWTKGFASGAGQTAGGTMARVVFWMIGLMTAPLGWAMSGGLWAWAWAAAYAACALQVGVLGRRIGSFRGLTACLYPVPLLFFFFVFARSSRRSGRAVNWKGRSIRAD